MARRLPSNPPVIGGFSPVHVLGSGGFADVFLYEQDMPRRQVAVKVLLDEVVDDRVRQMFQAEANLMARLSTHPSILTVFQASVAADGRPYLVMELCSSSLSERYRREPIPVSEVLSIGIRIGSALETAHREGVLHRDIKPSNILLTAYGNPVLSDFGIAATIGGTDPDEPIGMSIPWSAPEVLIDESRGTIQSEVYSLAATVYSLLAGRSPFEVRGGKNGANDLMHRIDKGGVKPTGRTDVPPSLERLLASALSRKPQGRPATVMELVRGFQQVEAELGIPQTSADVAVEAWAISTPTAHGDRTVIRELQPPHPGRCASSDPPRGAGRGRGRRFAQRRHRAPHRVRDPCPSPDPFDPGLGDVPRRRRGRRPRDRHGRRRGSARRGGHPGRGRGPGRAVTAVRVLQLDRPGAAQRRHVRHLVQRVLEPADRHDLRRLR